VASAQLFFFKDLTEEPELFPSRGFYPPPLPAVGLPLLLYEVNFLPPESKRVGPPADPSLVFLRHPIAKLQACPAVTRLSLLDIRLFMFLGR